MGILDEFAGKDKRSGAGAAGQLCWTPSRTLTHQSSETVEPWHSYWHHRPTRDFPPKTIYQPED